MLSEMREELEKKALALKNLSYMGKRLAAGTALGAAGGAAAGATGAGEGKRLSGALKGAVGGATLGGAAGYAAPRAAAHMRSGASTVKALKNVGGEAASTLRGASQRVRSSRVLEQAKGINPDAAGAAAVQKSLKHVPPASMRQLEGAITPQMKALGMTPEAAAQLMNMGRHGNEPINAAIARQLAPRSMGRTFTPAAADMATKAASVDQFKEKKAEGLSGDDPYLLDQIGKPKTKNLGAMPPNKSLAKQAMIPGAGTFASSVQKGLMNPAKKLQQSQLIGVPKMEQMKVKPPNIKVGFATSQFSGTLGEGRFNNYASHIPSFVNPPVKTAGPPSEKKAKTKAAAMLDEFAKLNAIQSPQSQITKSQKIGTPRASGPPGPSIQQLSKPIGFGKPMPGAIKPQQGI